MKIINQEHKTVPIDTIKPHPQNPREGDIGAIHTSITKNGFYGAIIVQKSTGHVLAGNHRLAAAQQAGATEIPAIIVDVDNETALKILLADNRTNDLASYDGYTEFQLRRGDTMDPFDLEALSFLGATAYHGGNSSNEPFNPVSIATDDVAFEIENKAWELFVHNIDLSNFSDALELAENVVRERDAWRRKRQERKTSE